MRPTDLKRNRLPLASVVAAVLLLSACSPAGEQAQPGPESAKTARAGRERWRDMRRAWRAQRTVLHL